MDENLINPFNPLKMDSHPADCSIAETRHRIVNGEWNIRDVIAAHIDRIAARDVEIGAYTFVDEKAADAIGQASFVERPLGGIAFAVKDLVDVRNWEITRGSRHYVGHMPVANAAIIDALVNAGAVPLGLAKTYELATVGPDPTGLYPQPANPWNPAHVTGGSSSGSAAAVASGTVRFAIGTDTGGSVRSPAAYCGIVGFKPSHGLLSMEGVAPLSPSMDHLGLLSRTVEELQTVFGALVPPAINTSPNFGKVIYARNWCDDESADPQTRILCDAGLSTLSLLGYKIEVVDFPPYQPIEDAAATVIAAEAFEVYADAIHRTPDDFGEKARNSILLGENISADQLGEAKAILAEFRNWSDALFQSADLLAMPTVMAPAPTFDDCEGREQLWTAMRTIPFNATGQPAISVPMGFSKGLPLGLQLVAARGDDHKLLEIASRFEAATDHQVMSPYFC